VLGAGAGWGWVLAGSGTSVLGSVLTRASVLGLVLVLVLGAGVGAGTSVLGSVLARASVLGLALGLVRVLASAGIVGLIGLV